MDLLDGKTILVPRAEDDAAAGGAEVDGGGVEGQEDG
jgi:hypothetical protein